MPTPTSVLCSDHFVSDCFDRAVSIKESLGFKQQKKRVLLPSATPTVFNRNHDRAALTQPVVKGSSSAIDKLERKRVGTRLTVNSPRNREGMKRPLPIFAKLKCL